jgi:hypothetical protein
MGADSQNFVSGVSFTFGGGKYTATQISVSRSAAEIDCTSTDMNDNDPRRYRAGEAENIDIKVDWIGLSVPSVTATQTFVLSGFPGSTGTKALCTGLSISANAGDVIKGSATFKVSFD